MQSGSSFQSEIKTLASSDARLSDQAPTEDAFTAYDERHFGVYLGLLVAEAEGVSDEEIGRTVLFIDGEAEPERLRLTLQSHLARARWLAANPERMLQERELGAAIRSSCGR